MNAMQEQKVNEKFAEKNNLSIDEMNMRAQEIYNNLNADEFENDDARWARAHRRVRGAFRKKARSMTNAMDGMIVCRMTNRDFDRNQYDYAMRILESQGLDTARSQGLVDKDGNPIYRWGDKAGQVILNQNNNPGRPQASGRAIGYTFEKNADGEYESIDSRFIIISKKKTDDAIPVCQVGRLSLSVNDKKQDGFFNDNFSAYYNDSSLSNEHKAPYDYDEVQEILGQWNKAFGDNMYVISEINALQDFAKEHAYSKDNKKAEYDFCVVPGIVSAISPGATKYNNDTVVLEFIDYDTLETTTLFVYVPKEMLQGLAMVEDDQGIFVLQASSYVDKEGNTKTQWHLGGFLHVDDDVDVEEFFGVDVDEGDE